MSLSCYQAHEVTSIGEVCLHCSIIYCPKEEKELCVFCGEKLEGIEVVVEEIAGAKITWVILSDVVPVGLAGQTQFTKHASFMVQEIRGYDEAEIARPVIFETKVDIIKFIRQVTSKEYRDMQFNECVNKERFSYLEYDGKRLVLLNHQAEAEELGSLLVRLFGPLTDHEIIERSYFESELHSAAIHVLKQISESYGVDLSESQEIVSDMTEAFRNRFVQTLLTYRKLNGFNFSNNELLKLGSFLDGRLTLSECGAERKAFYVDIGDAVGFFLDLLDMDLLALSSSSYPPVFEHINKQISSMKSHLSQTRAELAELIRAVDLALTSIQAIENCDTNLETVIWFSSMAVKFLLEIPEHYFWASTRSIFNAVAQRYLDYRIERLDTMGVHRPLKDLEYYTRMDYVFHYANIDDYTKVFLGKFLVDGLLGKVEKIWMPSLLEKAKGILIELVRILEDSNSLFSKYEAYISSSLDKGDTISNTSSYVADACYDFDKMSILAYVHKDFKLAKEMLSSAEGIVSRNKVRFPRIRTFWIKFEYSMDYSILEDISANEENLEEGRNDFYLEADKAIVCLAKLIVHPPEEHFDPVTIISSIDSILVPYEKLFVPEKEVSLLWKDLQVWYSTYNTISIFLSLFGAERANDLRKFKGCMREAYSYVMNIVETSSQTDPIFTILNAVEAIYKYSVCEKYSSHVIAPLDSTDYEKNLMKLSTELDSLPNNSLDSYFRVTNKDKVYGDRRDIIKRVLLRLKELRILDTEAGEVLKSQAILLVEGKIDKAVLSEFASKLLPDHNFFFYITENWENTRYVKEIKTLNMLGKQKFVIWDGDTYAKPKRRELKTQLEKELTQRGEKVHILKKNTIEDYIAIPNVIIRAFPSLSDNVEVFDYFRRRESKKNKKEVLKEFFKNSRLGKYNDENARIIANSMLRDEIDLEFRELFSSIGKVC